MGSVRFGFATTRQIQYLASQIRAMKITITSTSNGITYQQAMTAPTLSGNSFSFDAINLPVDSYTARVDAYMDAAQAILGGTSTSNGFSVTSGGTTTLTFPALTLAATPVGNWKVAPQVNLSSGYVITNYKYVLTETDGTTVTNSGMLSTANWSNVVCFPTGISTTSVTVTAKKGGKTVKKTAIATIAVQAGITVISNVTISIP